MPSLYRLCGRNGFHSTMYRSVSTDYAERTCTVSTLVRSRGDSEVALSDMHALVREGREMEWRLF